LNHKFLINVEQIKYSGRFSCDSAIGANYFYQKMLLVVCSDVELSLRLCSEIPANSRAINVTCQIPLPSATSRCLLVLSIICSHCAVSFIVPYHSCVHYWQLVAILNLYLLYYVFYKQI